MKPYLFIRGLRQVDHTVFCVENGQKTYRDPLFGTPMPYSSGQQVKRSILDTLVEQIDKEKRAPITFNYELTTNGDQQSLSQKEPWSPCDPLFADQLVGGWMRAQLNSLTLKRRSPLSISAMRPLHPSLARTSEESLTFDRSENPSNNPVKVRNTNGEVLSEAEVNDFLQSNERTLPRRHWIPRDKVGPRAEGIFVFDIAIDLRRLFKVSTNQHDPELSPTKIEELLDNDWERTSDEEFIICPVNRREEIIAAIAHAITNWRITSNQSRTYSPQATIAMAVSNNANLITSAIRADLREDGRNADPIIDHVDGVNLFIALSARGYITGVTGAADAMVQAENHIKEQLLNFSYD